MAAGRLRARADACAAGRARRAASRAAGGARRRDERQVDGDADGRGAPAATRGSASGRTSPRTSAHGPSGSASTARRPTSRARSATSVPPRSGSERRSSRRSPRRRLVAFRTAEVDAAVVEAGLGGRHDATNVLDGTRVVVLTNVSLEHTDVLGGTREAIAAEKLAVIRPGCTVVLGEPEWLALAREAGAGAVIVEIGRVAALAAAAASAFLGATSTRRRSSASRSPAGSNGAPARSGTARTTPTASGGSWSICRRTTTR